MAPSNVITINALPANASHNSTSIWTQCNVRMSFQFSSTGTAAGTLQLQVSNDQAPSGQALGFTPTNWSNVGTAVTVTAGPAVFLIPATELAYEYVRAVYTDSTSGTATGTVSVRAKGINLI